MDDLRLNQAIAYTSDIGVVGVFRALMRLRGLILLPTIAWGLGAATCGAWTQLLVFVSIERVLACQESPGAWHLVRAGEIYEFAGERAQARFADLSALEVNPGNLAAHWASEQYLLRLDAAGG